MTRQRTNRLHIRHRDAVTSAYACRLDLSKTQESARNGSRRASETPRRGEIDASHHGDTLQNAALTCTNTVPRRRRTAPRGRISNVEYPPFQMWSPFVRAASGEQSRRSAAPSANSQICPSMPCESSDSAAVEPSRSRTCRKRHDPNTLHIWLRDTVTSVNVRCRDLSGCRNRHANPGIGATAGLPSCEDPASTSTKTIHPGATCRRIRKPRPVNARSRSGDIASSPKCRESRQHRIERHAFATASPRVPYWHDPARPSGSNQHCEPQRKCPLTCGYGAIVMRTGSDFVALSAQPRSEFRRFAFRWLRTNVQMQASDLHL